MAEEKEAEVLDGVGTDTTKTVGDTDDAELVIDTGDDTDDAIDDVTKISRKTTDFTNEVSQIPKKKTLIPMEIPIVTPVEAPNVTPLEMPSVTPLELPSVTPLEMPSVTPLEMRSVTPSEMPSVTPSEMPSVTPLEMRSVTPLEMRSVTPLEMRSVTPLEMRSVTPLEMPSVTPLEMRSVTLPPRQEHIVLGSSKLHVLDSGTRQQSRNCKADNSYPAIMDLKNTINEVFWDKINSHVEDLLDTYDSEKAVDSLPRSKGILKPRLLAKIANKAKAASKEAASNRTAPRAAPLPKPHQGSTIAASTTPQTAAQKQSSYREPCCQRKSMLEISSPEIDDNLIAIFRRDMHCTDACVIRVVDRSGISRQSHINRTIPMVCIDRSLLIDNAVKMPATSCLRITRMQNTDSIDVFQSTDVFAKRSVIKGGDILRTLAVYEMRERFDFQEQSTLDKEARKIMYNKFTNMQRLDRGVGSRLKWQFMDRHNIEETDTIECLEEKAQVSFSIFGSDGYLLYESKKYRMKHVTMIKDFQGLYYFIPQKMLTAFGSQWNRRYRPNRTRVKTEGEVSGSVLEITNCNSIIYKNVTSHASPAISNGAPAISEAPRHKVHNKSTVLAARTVTQADRNTFLAYNKEIKTEPSDRRRFKTVDLSALLPDTSPASKRSVRVNRATNERVGMITRDSKRHNSGPRPDASEACAALSRGKAQSEGSAVVARPDVSKGAALLDISETRSTPLNHRTTPPDTSQEKRVIEVTPAPHHPVSQRVPLDSNLTLAVPRDQPRDGSAVRLLTVGKQDKKRPPDPANNAGKRITSIQSINVISDNKIYAKGEVLLTTKDHIIFRIPRNVEVVTKTSSSGS